MPAMRKSITGGDKAGTAEAVTDEPGTGKYPAGIEPESENGWVAGVS